MIPASVAAALFQIILLGTGNPRPEMDRFGPSILVEAGEHRILIDCGRGATQRLFQRDTPLGSVETVLFTHLHSDHVTGFPDFWLTGWMFGRTQPLHVWGPAGTTAMVRNLERAYAFDVHMRHIDEGLPAAGATIVSRDTGEGVVVKTPDGLRITAFLVDHGPVKPALGYRVEYGGYVAVFSGDTRPSDNLVKHAKGVDVLVHEVLSPEVERRRAKMTDPHAIEQVIAHHTTAEDAGKLFARIRPRLAVFSHIVPSVATEADVLPEARKNYDGRMVFGVDRMAIKIGPEIEVTYP
jgi:ribonuclease Z